MQHDPENQALEERRRLLKIIETPYPERKPGARTRTWENERMRAIIRLKNLESGMPLDEPDAPL